MFKHAVLLVWLQRLKADGAPLELLDTHAGAGLYDLSATPAARSGEARAGIGRVMDDPPPALAALARRVRELNGGGEGPLYPGSPLLAVGALRAGDGYLGCELDAGTEAELAEALRRRPGKAQARTRRADGYEAACAARAGVRRAVLIDPPFEAADEGARLAATLGAVLRRGEPAVVWAPLKDLDGFDRLLGRIEALRPPPSSVAVQVRLRPLDDPLRLNGCAMLLLGGPDLTDETLAIAEAVAARCGDAGARAVAERLAG